MSKLRAPLKPLLDEPLSELELQRMWRKLQGGQRALPERRRLHWPLAAAVGVGGMLVLLWAAPLLRHAVRPAPLTLRDQTMLSPHTAWGGPAEQRLALSDGSRIRLASDARLEVLDNRGPVFSTRLRHGRADFEVKPGGPRRWRVECDAISVEVIGTQFRVERTGDGAWVRVAHGVVAVRGQSIPGGEHKLRAGDELFVDRQQPSAAAAREVSGSAKSAHAPASTARAAQAPVPLTRPAAAAEAAPPSAAEQRSTSRPPLASQPSALAVAAAPRAALPLSPDERSGNQLSRMLQRADAARRAGDFDQARELLQQLIRVAPRGQYAAIAGLTLGRMLMLTQPLRAAEALRAALIAAPPADLREDMMVRLVEAETRAGQSERARNAAAAYWQAFPHGLRRAEVVRWIESP